MAPIKKTHLDGEEATLAVGVELVTAIHLRQLEHLVVGAEGMKDEIEEQEMVERIHGNLRRYRETRQIE